MASKNRQPRTQESLAITHPSLPRTSMRWSARTKGLPFSRMMLKQTVPPMPGRAAAFLLVHPTRGTVHLKKATPELLRVFFPALPETLAAGMLGLL